MAMADGAVARPEWRALEIVHELAGADVSAVSPLADWDFIAATRFRFTNIDVQLPTLGVPAFGINYGADMRLERTLRGRQVRSAATAGHLSILPPDDNSRWLFDKPGEIMLVVLNRAYLDRAIEEASGRSPRSVDILPQFVIRDLTMERISHQLLSKIVNPVFDSRLRTESLAQELAEHILQTHTSLDLRPPSRPHTMSPIRLKRVEDFIEANLGQDMSLMDIANAAGMSLFHFAKVFKQATRKSPHQYLTERRMLQARSLLHDGRLSIGDVACAVGLSQNRFGIVFKRLLGMTPSRFREVLSF
jgi:AraC family transcriptional regulator